MVADQALERYEAKLRREQTEREKHMREWEEKRRKQEEEDLGWSSVDVEANTV
jgi:hypothetical protein